MLKNVTKQITIAVKGGIFEDQYCMHGHSSELYSIWIKIFRFDMNGNKHSQTAILKNYNVSKVSPKLLKNIERYNYWKTY